MSERGVPFAFDSGGRLICTRRGPLGEPVSAHRDPTSDLVSKIQKALVGVMAAKSVDEVGFVSTEQLAALQRNAAVDVKVENRDGTDFAIVTVSLQRAPAGCDGGES